MTFLDRRFALSAHGTSVATEGLVGVTSFLTMADIVFVQPAVLGAAGMDFGAVMVATCLSTAFATTPTSSSRIPSCAAGIGLLIAMVGLQWAGVVVDSPGTLVTLGNLHSRPVVVSLSGLALTAVLMVRGVAGALLWASLPARLSEWGSGSCSSTASLPRHPRWRRRFYSSISPARSHPG